MRLAVPLSLVLAVLLALLPAGVAVAATTYTVRSGDSLWTIAQRHGTTVATLQSTNGLRTTTILPGQRLTIGGSATYTVRSGDTLWKIATARGTTVAALQSANGLRTTEIRPGQVLTIPGAGAGASTAAATTTATTASRGGTANLSAADADLIARLVRAEAEAEPYAGQVAVAAVILNRVRSSRFPNTVREVVYQRHQFEPVSNGRINIAPLEVHRRAVRDAAGGWDPSGGALFFFNPSKTSNSFLHSLAVTANIGAHRFAR